jgi:hypothetical protein
MKFAPMISALLVCFVTNVALADGGGQASGLQCKASSAAGEAININEILETGVRLSQDVWGDGSGSDVSRIESQTFQHTLSVGYNNAQGRLKVHITTGTIFITVLANDGSIVATKKLPNGPTDEGSVSIKTKQLQVVCKKSYVSYGG